MPVEPLIKPCPHCGSTSVRFTYHDDDPSSKAIVCDYTEGGCGATGGYRTNSAKAVAVWNKRIISDKSVRDLCA